MVGQGVRVFKDIEIVHLLVRMTTFVSTKTSVKMHTRSGYQSNDFQNRGEGAKNREELWVHLQTKHYSQYTTYSY